jgi:hypothetical protein
MPPQSVKYDLIISKTDSEKVETVLTERRRRELLYLLESLVII